MSIDDSDAALRIVEAGRRRAHDRMRDAFAHQAAAHADLAALDPETLDGLVTDAVDRAGVSLWRISLAEGAADEFGVPVHEALRHPAVSAAEQLVGAPDEPIAAPAAEPGAEAETETETETEPGAEAETEPAPGAEAEPEPAPGAEAETEPAPGAEAEPEPEPEPAPDPDPFSPPFEAEPPAPATPEAVPATPEMPPEPEPVAAIPEPTPEPAAAPTAAVAPAAVAAAAPQALRIPAVHESGIETLKPGDKDLELRISDAGLDVLRHSSGVAIGRLDWSEITAVDVEETKKGLRGRKRSQRLQVKTARGQATFELPGLTEEESAEHLEPMLDRLRHSGMLGQPEPE